MFLYTKTPHYQYAAISFAFNARATILPGSSSNIYDIRKVLYFVIKNIIIYKNFIFLFIILTIFLIVKFLKLYLFNQLLKDIIPYPPYFSDNSKKYRLKMYSYSAMRFRFAQLTLLSAANKAQSSLQANRPMSDNVKNFVKYNTLRKRAAFLTNKLRNTAVF